jgi:hypothetical protein
MRTDALPGEHTFTVAVARRSPKGHAAHGAAFTHTERYQRRHRTRHGHYQNAARLLQSKASMLLHNTSKQLLLG